MKQKMSLRKKLAALVLAGCVLLIGVLMFLLWKERSQRMQSQEFYSEISLSSMISGERISDRMAIADGFDSEVQYKSKYEEMHLAYPDMVGWIFEDEIVLDYPVVQGDDNDHYLHHLPDGTENPSGSIMMDYRCNCDWSSPVTILYGHHMKDGSMFGNLEKYKDEKYAEEHGEIFIFTSNGMKQMEIVDAFEIDENEAAMFENEAVLRDRVLFAEQLSQISEGAKMITWDEDKQFVVLYTCAYYHENARFIVIGSY